MIEINRNPSKKDLNVFGVLLILFFGLIGAMAQWRFHAPVAGRVIWILGTVVAAIYSLLPVVRRPIYLGWMYAALPIGLVVSHVILAITYYLVLTPIALIMRLLGHDPLQRAFDRSASTYWTPHAPPRDAKGYFRQF